MISLLKVLKVTVLKSSKSANEMMYVKTFDVKHDKTYSLEDGWSSCSPLHPGALTQALLPV